MFYSGSIIKGPLQVVWLAAHSDRRMKRQQALGTSIPDTVDKIMLHGLSAVPNRAQPTLGSAAADAVPLALRLSGQLLLGVVRVYKDQVVYLAEDAEGALCNLQVNAKARVPMSATAAGAADSASIQAGAGILGAAPSSAANLNPAVAVPADAARKQPSAAAKPADAAGGNAAGKGAPAGRVMSRLQQHADIEQLVATLGGIDEEEAFLTRDGSLAALPDWTTEAGKAACGTTMGKQLSIPSSPHGMLQARSTQAGLQASGRPGTAALQPGTSMLLSRGSTELQAASGLWSAGRRGSSSGFSPITEDEEVFDDVGPLPLDFDQQDGVWLLPSDEQEPAAHSPQDESADDVPAAAQYGRQPGLEAEGDRMGEEQGQGGLGTGSKQGEGRMDEDARGPPQQQNIQNGVQQQPEDSDIIEWHDAEPHGLEGEELFESRDQHAGHRHVSDMGAAQVQARLQQHLGLQVLKGDGVVALMERHVSGLPTTTLPTSAVRALLDDREAILHPEKLLLWASAEVASASQSERHAHDAVQLRDILLQAAVQQQDPVLTAVLQQLAKDVSMRSAAECCVKQNQLLQPSMQHVPEMLHCVAMGPVQPETTAHRAVMLPTIAPAATTGTDHAARKKGSASKRAPASSIPSHNAMRDGFARNWLSQQLAPYLLAPSKADDEDQSYLSTTLMTGRHQNAVAAGIPADPASVPLARLLHASGLVSSCPDALSQDISQLLESRQFSVRQQVVQMPQKHKVSKALPEQQQRHAVMQQANGKKSNRDQARTSNKEGEPAGADGAHADVVAKGPKPAAAAQAEPQQLSDEHLSSQPQIATETVHHLQGDDADAQIAVDEDVEGAVQQVSGPLEELLPATDGEVLLTEEEDSEEGDGREQRDEVDSANEEGLEDLLDEQLLAGTETGLDAASAGTAGLAMAVDGFTTRTRSLLTHLYSVVQHKVQQASQSQQLVSPTELDMAGATTPSKRMRLQPDSNPSTSQVLASPVSVAADVVPSVLATTAKARGSATRKAAMARIHCARMFVDLLVLQNRGFVNLKQQQAYQDIHIIPCPKLHAVLSSPGHVGAAQLVSHGCTPTQTAAITVATANGSSKKTAGSKSKGTTRKRLFAQ